MLVTFFPQMIFRLQPLMHVRKVVSRFLNEKSGNKRCVSDDHDMTLTVYMALNSNTNIQALVSKY